MTFIFLSRCGTVDMGLKARLCGQAYLGSNWALLLTGCMGLNRLLSLPESQFAKRKIISTY